MKKLGIFCVLLLVTGVAAMAQDVNLFADIDAVALTGEEMKLVVGGQPAGDCGETVAGTKAALKMRRKDALRYEGEAQLYGFASDVADVLPGGWRFSGGPRGTQQRYFDAIEKANDADADIKRLSRKLYPGN